MTPMPNVPLFGAGWTGGSLIPEDWDEVPVGWGEVPVGWEEVSVGWEEVSVGWGEVPGDWDAAEEDGPRIVRVSILSWDKDKE